MKRTRCEKKSKRNPKRIILFRIKMRRKTGTFSGCLQEFSDVFGRFWMRSDVFDAFANGWVCFQAYQLRYVSLIILPSQLTRCVQSTLPVPYAPENRQVFVVHMKVRILFVSMHFVDALRLPFFPPPLAPVVLLLPVF